MDEIYSVSITVPDSFLDRFVAILDERGLLSLSDGLCTFNPRDNIYCECRVDLTKVDRDKLFAQTRDLDNVIYSIPALN